MVATGIMALVPLFDAAGQGMKQSIDAPDFKAELAVGFNYDYLKSPLRVNFDEPRGYFGVNIPIKYTLDQSVTSSLTSSASGQFNSGDEFAPKASARQYPNTTIRVDVPMLGGVASFSNMQMMHMSYSNVLGEPNFTIASDPGAQVNLFMRGMVSVPLNISMGWETMNFGYAYEVNKWLELAFNMSRNSFAFDMNGKVDVDIDGYVDPVLNGVDMGQKPLQYSLHNTIDGHYTLVRWTPTVAARVWRFSVIGRFGMKAAQAHGSLDAKYSVPFFVDPESFGITDSFSNSQYLVNNLNRFLNGDVNTMEYSTTNNLVWKMPHAFTIVFDIVPNKLFISYTKTVGELGLELYDPHIKHLLEGDTSTLTTTNDTLDMRISVKTDHYIMLHGNFNYAFFNLGVYSMDVDFRNQTNILSKAEGSHAVKLGNGIMLPVLSLGATVGSKIQVLLEADVLPLTALKAGIIYNF